MPFAAMGEAHVAVQDFVFAHRAEAAAPGAGAAGIRPQGDAMHPDRRVKLEELFAPSTLRDIPLSEGQKV